MQNKNHSKQARARIVLLTFLSVLVLAVFPRAAVRCETARAVRVPILMYHHIRTTQKDDIKMLKDLSCSLDDLKRHCRYLKANGYSTITFQDLFEYFQNDVPLPEKPVILTFDDGYQDNWNAYKELRKKNMKGVFFVVLKTLGDSKHLSKTQVLAMSRDGMEIGSHSLHHEDLTKITEQKAEQEILQSKEALELFLGRPVLAFCYPGGKFNKKTLKILARSTYWFARTTRTGVSTIEGKDLKLRTVRIHDYTDEATLSQLLGEN